MPTVEAVHEPEQMTWLLRGVASLIGGVSSLFAIGLSQPSSYKEGVWRFFAGCFVAGCCTGFTMDMLRITVKVDSVLVVGIVWGLTGWWIMGGVVSWAKGGGMLSYLAQRVQEYTDKAKGDK